MEKNQKSDILSMVQLEDLLHTVPCGICLYKWDNNELSPLFVNQQFSEMLGEDALAYLNGVKNLQYTHVHPDDLERLRTEAFHALNQTSEVDTTYRSLNFKTQKYIWVHMRGKKIEQPDGTSLVYVSYYDVTKEHLVEQKLLETEKEISARYELERNKTSVKDDNMLAHAVINLTTGEVLEYNYKDGSEVPCENRDAFTYGQERAANLLIDEEERKQFVELNCKENLIKRFLAGEQEFRLDYRRIIKNGDINWVRSVLHLVRDPRNKDILLFEYWYDIEEEKMMEYMYTSLASDNYDFVARINAKNGFFKILPKKGMTCSVPPVVGNDADAAFVKLAEENIIPEDRDFTIGNITIAGIRKNLEKQERFQFTFREKLPNGKICYKKITEYYLDRQREIVVVTREDISELLRMESEKNEMLATALEAANQASNAKSQFLSRISHELRTPLNAIIGFMELAKGAEKKQIEDYMANSDIAAKQLLSIINDVLDMSSIEAGKLKIAHAPFDFKYLISSITNMFLSQCEEKGLIYETLMLTPIDEWLMGDQLRINQILINLLNNAVKFTSTGSVKLKISQIDASHNQVFIRFEISDTGCGMSKEMLERLFKPFEQESSLTAQKYGGSGLGLSIVNNLVSMMDGVIRVESEQGVGTTFFVDIPFIRSEVTHRNQLPEDVSTMRVLVVDDEELERKYLSIVLGRMSVRHTCIADGGEALSVLEEAEKDDDPYTICLVDWKMPNMSGLEITKRIRERYGKNVVVIVVSAYEHNQADESVKQAGANMFIAKPLFQSTLFDLFMTLTGGRMLHKHLEKVVYQFKGKRILLAEDNAMNRRVAEGLVKKFGIECDSAEDGQIVLDKFLSSKPGYYDAILMDIQMPNLNGFEATAAIRSSNHKDAKSIQIIALTANAFNEDIAKSLSTGMNAHVTKPIEPDMLGQALDKAFHDNENRD